MSDVDGASGRRTVAEVAARLSVVRAQLHLGAVATTVGDEQVTLLGEWYDLMTREGVSDPETMSFSVAVTTDLDELTWRIGGPASTMMRPIGAALDWIGVSGPTVDRFVAVGSRLEPSRIALALQVGAAGIDAEWSLPAIDDDDRDELGALPLPAGLLAALAGADSVPVSLAGVFGPAGASGATWMLARRRAEADAEATVDETIESIQRLYAAAGVDELAIGRLVAIAELHRGRFAVSRWYSETGMVKFGLVVIEPPLELLLALVDPEQSPAVDERFAELLATLGTDAPSSIEIESWQDRVRVRVHVAIPHLD